MEREEAIRRIKAWNLDSDDREVLETLIPELAESEDEKIRKELKEAFAAYDIESKWNGIPIRSIFAWIEKQAKSERVIKAARRVLNNWLDGTDCPDVSGDFTELEYAIRKYDGAETPKESLHIQETCKENANSFADGIIEVRSFQRGMEEGRRLERQKEQKQAQTSEEKEYVRTIKSIISDFIRDKKPENLAYYQRIYDWLDGRHVPFSCGHENGEPADEDGPFDEDAFLEDELSAFLQNYDKEYDDDAAVSDVARHFYEIGKKQNEQKSVSFSCSHENGKPAEWSGQIEGGTNERKRDSIPCR